MTKLITDIFVVMVFFGGAVCRARYCLAHGDRMGITIIRALLWPMAVGDALVKWVNRQEERR